MYHYLTETCTFVLLHAPFRTSIMSELVHQNKQYKSRKRTTVFGQGYLDPEHVFERYTLLLSK